MKSIDTLNYYHTQLDRDIEAPYFGKAFCISYMCAFQLTQNLINFLTCLVSRTLFLSRYDATGAVTVSRVGVKL